MQHLQEKSKAKRTREEIIDHFRKKEAARPPMRRLPYYLAYVDMKLDRSSLADKTLNPELERVSNGWKAKE